MRPWVHCLFYSSEAHVDFLKYVEEVKKELLERMYNRLIIGELDKARSFAFELAAYEGIANIFKRETKEFQKQISQEVENGRTNY